MCVCAYVYIYIYLKPHEKAVYSSILNRNDNTVSFLKFINAFKLLINIRKLLYRNIVYGGGGGGGDRDSLKIPLSFVI